MGSTAGSSKHHARPKNYISWFEIPVYDINRAAAFYNAIYGIEMEISVNGDFAMAYFPADEGVGGALIAGPGCYPSDTGSLIYLNAGNDLDGVLGRVELAGGRVIMARTHINDASGNFALFLDSEGNRLALHEGPARTGPAVKPVKATTKQGKKAARPASAKSRAVIGKKVAKKTTKKKR
ncbi:MAG TPA: VOC family protein [Flavobacteriales bacterium]|nr:VOC family protein [Flavobacteriales bacterium]